MRKKSSNSVRIKYAPSKRKVETFIKKYVESIKERVDLKLAIIFGSYAKNTYAYGSDIDLFLIAEKLPKRNIERQDTLADVNSPIQIETFPYTPEEFEKMIKENHPLINEVIQNGKVIYIAQDFKKTLMKINKT